VIPASRGSPICDEADVGQAEVGTGFQGRDAIRLGSKHEVYGRDSKLRRWVEERHQLFVLAVAVDQRLWRQDMRQHRVDEIANKLPKRAWKRLSAGQGAKGERLYDWALVRWAEHEGWQHTLLVRRSLDAKPEFAFYFTYARKEKSILKTLVANWADFHLLPGVVEAIGRLNRAGMRVIVVSNQRGIALGLYTAINVEAIHRSLQNFLLAHGAHVDGFYFCPHDKQQCNCRKPLHGMFEQAVAQFPEITAERSVMIGDSLSDIEFGRRLDMRTVFIDGDPIRQKPGAEVARALAGLCCESLSEAVNWLLPELAPSRQA